MFDEIDYVRVKRDFLEQGVKKGDKGTVVYKYEGSPDERYEVEFSGADGATRSLITVGRGDIEKIG